jgi:regulator of cell morphogenesis and NO signaling
MIEHFGIDLPFQEKSVQDVCDDNKINAELFLTFANLYNGVQDILTETITYSDILTIINYLKNSHRYYSEEIYPNILETIKQMNIVNDHKEIALVEKFFGEYFNEVNEHLNYENNIVFPYIAGLFEKSLATEQSCNFKIYSVDEYKEHHSDIEEKLNDLKNLLIKYLPQKNDRAIRRELLLSLFELEYDLKIHSQIEDFILIPLVAQMEFHLKKSK